MYKIYIRLSRSWKNHLRSVKDENKIQVYQALSVLIQETSLEVFTDLLDKFLCHWEEKEPDFVTYFREYYASRPGIQTCVLHVHGQIYKVLINLQKNGQSVIGFSAIQTRTPTCSWKG